MLAASMGSKVPTEDDELNDMHRCSPYWLVILMMILIILTFSLYFLLWKWWCKLLDRAVGILFLLLWGLIRGMGHFIKSTSLNAGPSMAAKMNQGNFINK